MSPQRIAGAALLLACLAGTGATADAQIFPQSQRALQSAAARRLLPAEPRLRPPAEGAPLAGATSIRLRVWATRDYRAQVMSWQDRFRALIARVNRVTRGWPGVEFEIVEMGPWAADSADRPLVEVLKDLSSHDPGTDVDCVIGLASALQVIPDSLEALGYAHSPGRHMVLRNLYSLSDYRLAREHFDQIDGEERDQILSARTAHRELVVFLHEWAHTLGALHAAHQALVMSPDYSQEQARMDDGNARLIEAVLRAREQGPEAMRTALRRALVQTREPAWDPRDRARALGRLGEAAPRQQGPARGDDALRRCTAARDLPAGAQRRAAIELDCAAAAAGGVDSPWPLILLAEAHLDAGRDDLAVAALDAGEEALAAHPDPAAWGAVAQLRRRARFPSLALLAARRAGVETTAEIEPWHDAVTRRFAIPQDAAAQGLPPQREREYILAMETAEAAASEGRRRVAEQLATQLLRDFPGLPGGALVRCEVHLREGRLAAAQSACLRALRLQEAAAPAHVLAAMVAVRLGRCRQARDHSGRALALDPSLGPALQQVQTACR